jgi:CheY-like chemotaxis protein
MCVLDHQINTVNSQAFSILAKSSSHSHKITPQDNAKSPEILLVDDDTELLEILSIDLSQRGLSVTTSTNGQEAVRIAQENLPNLIVLDINIPNGNGFEVVEKLRSEPKLRNISLIIYSGRDLTGEQKTKLSLGPTRFLTKTRVSCADFRNNVLELLNSDVGQTNTL